MHFTNAVLHAKQMIGMHRPCPTAATATW